MTQAMHRRDERSVALDRSFIRSRSRSRQDDHRSPAVMKSTILLVPALLALSMPAVAGVDPPRAMCYVSELETSTNPSPLSHGIELDVVCAHVSRAVIGVDREGSRLAFRDGTGDLLQEGARWIRTFREENPGRLFFSTRSFNAIEFKPPDGRVLPIAIHTHALPRGSAALLEGSVVVYVAGSRTTTLATTAAALREGEPLALPDGNGPPAVPVEAGSSNDSPMFRLSGGAAFADLVRAPEGVTTTNFMGRRLLVVEQRVPGEAPIELEVRIGERLSLPVQIEIPIEATGWEATQP
jgi:hypothetical protein